jgi:hypothetical protein
LTIFRLKGFRLKPPGLEVSALALVALSACLVLPLPGWAKDKDKQKPASAEMVDSGSFGVYSAGHRVATETFSIHSEPDGSVVSSEFKSEQGEQKAAQSSELDLTPSVELRRYTWKESLPEKSEATVEPSEAFLVEHFGVSAEQKQQEQSFLLPASTSILDDYFFIHREVLAWKYLATACRKDKGGLQCPPNQKVQFGTLNPHVRSSMPVSMEFSGQEKLTMHGAVHEFSRFVLRSENGDWTFWLDDQFKLVRLLSDSGTEVLRD